MTRDRERILFELARERAEAFYGRRFDRVVSIGDGVWDVRTAIELDVPFVGIGTGSRADQLRLAGAGIVLPDYSDLDAFMTALETRVIPASHPEQASHPERRDPAASSWASPARS